jgi:hypothetical protein
MATTAKTQNHLKGKQQLYLDRVNQFFEPVKTWVPQFKTIQTEKSHFVQDETGKYQTPFLSIVKTNLSDEISDAFSLADLLPEGTSVLMGEGIIKIDGLYGQEFIIYMLKQGWLIQDRFGQERQMYQGIDDDGWYWLESSHRNRVHLVDETVFMDLLKMVSLYD